MRERILAFILILVVLFSALFCPVRPVHAENDIIDDLVYYALTVSGYMKTDLVNSGGGGHSYGKPVDSTTKDKNGNNLLTSLRNAFQYAYDNHNITVDDGGNYIFDTTITKNFYDLIGGGVDLGDAKAKLVTDFSSCDFSQVYAETTPGFHQTIENERPQGKYMQIMGIYHNPDDEGYGFTGYYCFFYSLDTVDFAYYGSSGSTSDFHFARDGSLTKVPAVWIYQSRNRNGEILVYNYNYGNYPVFVGKENQNDNIGIGKSVRLIQPRYQNSDSTEGCQSATYPVKAFGFDEFPSNCLYCNCPLLLGDTLMDGLSAYNSMISPSSVVVNNYNTLPSVTNNQISNNDWNSVYNSYVTNVNNNYSQNNNSWDYDSFISVMNEQNTLLVSTLEKGIDDVTNVVESLNDKVQRVLEALKEIKTLMENGSGGGSATVTSGGSIFTSAQVEELLTNIQDLCDNQVTSSTFNETLSDVIKYLKSIDSGTTANLTELQLLNQNLTDLYDFLVYGDPDNGKQSPYEIIQNLYIKVTELSAELAFIKDNDAQLKLYVADLLTLVQQIQEKEENDYSEELREISNYLSELNTKVEDDTSDISLAEIKAILLRIETACNSSDGVDLSPVVNVLNNIDAHISNIDFNYFDTDIDFDFNVDIRDPEKLKKLKDTFVDDALQTALQAAVPFCFVVGVGVLIDMLACDPVAPSFTIPFAVSGTSFGTELGVESDMSVNVDLAEWDKPHQLIENMYIILFILLLMWASFRLIKFAVAVFM